MEELKVEKAIQDIYPDDIAWCYGCGRLNDDGHHLRTGGWHGDKTITIYTPESKYMGIPGFIYGGLIASLIDCHGTGSQRLPCIVKMDMKLVMERSHLDL